MKENDGLQSAECKERKPLAWAAAERALKL